MRLNISTLAFLVFLVAPAHAQNSTTDRPENSFHVVGVQVGLNQVKEENLVPRVHAGFVLTASYEYRSLTDRFCRFVFDLGFSRLTAKPEEFAKTVQFGLAASYSYCFGLIDSQPWAVFIGPTAGVYSSAALFPNWDESHLYWATVYSVGGSAVASYSLGDGTRLFSSLSIPLFSLYSRPVLRRLYKYDDPSFGGIVEALNSALKGGFWNRALFVYFTIEYQFPAFETKVEAFTYSLGFARVQRPEEKPLVHITHQFGLRILL